MNIPRAARPALATVLACFVLSAAAACGDGRGRRDGGSQGPMGAGGAEGSPPVPPGGGDGGRGAGRADDVAGPRTVSLRSPFGNIEPGNLIMNGDFELGIGAVVPGWYAVADDHVMPFRYRTGGACRSGLLCAEIAAGQSLVATMVALPVSGPVTVRAHVKPRSGRLGDVTVRLTLQNLAGEGLGSVLLAPEGTAGEDGFGRYQASFEIDRPYDIVSLVVEARDSTLVDDVSVRAGAPEAKRPFPWPDSHSIPASVDRVIRLAREEPRGRRTSVAAPPALSPAPRVPRVAPPVALPR